MLCLADWVLVEDLGFFGGTGTDPNSMLPMACSSSRGTLAAFRVPLEQTPTARRGGSGRRWRPRGHTVVGPHRTGLCGRSLAALGASPWWIGAAPMAVAAVNQSTDPILSEALDGTPNSLTPGAGVRADRPARPRVSLASLRGHVLR